MKRVTNRAIVFVAGLVVGVFITWNLLPRPEAMIPEKLDIDAGLERIVHDGNANAQPLGVVIAQLARETQTNIVLRKTLEEVGIDADRTPVTVRLHDVPLRIVLQTVLDDAGASITKLGSYVQDGVIYVTTADDVLSRTYVRIYDVSDLIDLCVKRARNDSANGFDLDLNTFGSAGMGGTMIVPSRSGGCSSSALFAGSSTNGASTNVFETEVEAEDELVRIITDTVDPDTWRDNGGSAGSIRILNGRLIITQTRKGHGQVAALLRDIRHQGKP